VHGEAEGIVKKELQAGIMPLGKRRRTDWQRTKSREGREGREGRNQEKDEKDEIKRRTRRTKSREGLDIHYESKP
jgi:hypothetical protein